MCESLLALVWCVIGIQVAQTTYPLSIRGPRPHLCLSQVKNVGAGRLELNYCIPVLQQPRFGDQVQAGLQIGLGTEFL